MLKAEGKVKRITGETDVSVVLSAYGSGQVQVNTGLVFFDHLVNSLGFWALFDLRVEAGPVVPGRSSLDEGHHLCEDVGLCVGQALRQGLDPLLGLDSRSIVRFGHALVPMDDALVFAAIDISGRPYFAEDLRTKPVSYTHLDVYKRQGQKGEIDLLGGSLATISDRARAKGHDRVLLWNGDGWQEIRVSEN